MRTPLPSKVRLMIKSLDNCKAKLAAGVFKPSGTGSKAYYENRIKWLEPWVAKFIHLKDLKAKPTKVRSYY